MKKITPCLWFNGNGDDAFSYYQEIFPDCEVIAETRTLEEAPGTPGALMMGHLRILDQEILFLNAPTDLSPNESFSLNIDCADQAEVDKYWNALTADGGEESMCGWCKDKFGVSWQIVPCYFTNMIQSGEPDQIERMTDAMLSMKKLNVESLRSAAEGNDNG